MRKSAQEKYLGNTVHESGDTTYQIDERLVKGRSVISQISAILNTIPFGPARVQAGIYLRNSKFLGVLLFSIEAWHGITREDIHRLERLDLELLRIILYRAHSKTSEDFIYLELGLLKIRYIVKSRRVLYLQAILWRKDTDLVKQYLMVQRQHRSKGDFHFLVKKDLEDLNFKLEDKEIIEMGKNTLKNNIKKKLMEIAFNDYSKGISKLSKVKNIRYTTLKIQEYLVSPLLNDNQRKLLIKLRSKMEDIKSNFKKKYQDLDCPLKCDKTHVDSQENLLVCTKLKINHNSVSHADLFKGVQSKKEAVITFQKLLIQRKQVIKETNKKSSPMHCFPKHVQHV